jgi:hypothetical protein
MLIFIRIFKSFTFLAIILFCEVSFGQGKFGALAIDKTNGFYYGWAVDQKTQNEADNRAIKECNDRGGNCAVVLRFGEGMCASYRTISVDVGTSYGWGLAKTQNEADRIANSECLKRSNGEPCSNNVWGCNSNTEKDEEFWSGEKEKEVTNKKDDSEFWDGGTAKQENNKETDFWEGKGSSEEERKFTENTKPDESDQFIGNVRSRTGKVRIFCVDTGQEDGDLVRIINNGATLMDNIYLTNAGKSYWFDLQFGQNNIEILALNQGTTGANTAAFKVFDDKGALIAEKGWHLNTGFKGKLLILKI